MVEQILTRFRFLFSKVQLTPLAVDHGLTAPPSDESFESSGPYPKLVGCLMSLMTCTRPDLAYPLSVLARFVAPGRHRPSHWYAAKRVAKYVASTSGMGLVLGGKQPVTLTGFSDSSWANDAETRRSTQGYSFSLGTGVVSWRSTRASYVSGSSCEAEVYAAAMVAQELRWLSFLLTDLGAGAGGAGAGDPRVGGAGAQGPVAAGAGAGGTGAGGTGAGGTVQRQPFFVPPPPPSLPPPGSPDSPLPAPSPYNEQTDSLTERHPESDLVRAASPTVTRLLATVVTDPSFESTTASALVVELVDFAAACRLDYAASLVAESQSDCPPSVGGECALGTNVLEDKQEDFECLTAVVPHLVAMLLAPEGDPDAPDISTFLHEEIWLRRPPGFTGSFPAGTQWSLRQPVYGLHQAPCEWHDTLRTTLATLGFAPSTADPSLFLRTDTSLPPFYILVYIDDLAFAIADTEALALVKSELQKRHTCTDLAPPSDESIEPSGPYPELVGCLMYLMTCTRPDLAYSLSILAHYVAPRRHRPEHWEAAKRVLRYLCNTSDMGLVLGGQGPVVLTGHADAS
ncbi:unnamed protein product [Closterium sp. NIES-54]